MPDLTITLPWFDPQSDRTQIWSCGGGTQSTAIAALIVQGRLPKPDVAFIVDTERENGDVFPYLRQWTIPALASVGVELCVVRKSDYATVDLWSKNGRLPLMPGFTDKAGKIGKLSNYCSGEWKREVGWRWLRSQGVKQCDQWVGFSLDEITRMKKDKRQWARAIYPLIGLRMSRQDSIRLVESMGWPTPPRSSCWMCPNKRNDEWWDMKQNRPDDFRQACQLERDMQERDPHFWLHPSCVPLAEVNFTAPSDDAMQDILGCSSGECFV